MKKTKRCISLILCLLMTVSLITVFSGCGNSKSSIDNSEYVYVPTYVKISGVDSIGSVTLVGDEFYFNATDYNYDNAVTYTEDSSEEGSSASSDTAFYKCYAGKFGMDGVAEKLFGIELDSVPEGQEGGCYVDNTCFNSSGDAIYLLDTYSYYYDLPEGFNGSEEDKYEYEVYNDTHKLVYVDQQGNVKGESYIDDYLPEDSGIYGAVLDDEGNIYVFYDQGIAVFDSQVNKQFEISTDYWVYESFRLADGGAGVTMYTDDSLKLYEINPETKQLDEICDIPENYNSLYTASGEYNLLYTTGTYLYGIRADNGEKEKILNWISSDIDSDNISSVTTLEDGRIAAVTCDWSGDEPDNELVLLTKAKASEVDQKETITFATQSLDWNLKSQIIKFNRTNNDYRIDVLDYSEFNTDDDYSAGLQKLKTEILSGQVPDIIDLNGMNVSQLASKGLLEDLLPYIEQDSELGKDALMDNYVEAASTDGKLYIASPSYSITTAVGSSKLFGDKTGITIGELLDAYKDVPDGTSIFDEWTTQSDIIYSCIALDMDYYVDWVNKTCNFDSDEFKQLLEFAKLFPTEYNWEEENYDEDSSSENRIAAGKQMLSDVYLYSVSDYSYAKAQYGGNCVFTGMPTADGVGNTMSLDMSIAMSSTCSNKDAAWSFIRTLFTKDYQINYTYSGFSTNKEAFEYMLKQEMTPQYETDENGNYVLDENGNKIEIPRGGYSDEFGNEINYYYLSQEDADEIRNIVNSTTKILNTQDTSIADIVIEEADSYFNGSKSADDVAKSVQNRVGIYINEQG